MEVPIRNIGRGPAILRNVIFGVGPGLDAIGSFNIQVLPPKEEVMATLDMKNTNPEFFAAFVEGARNQNLKVRVQYSDIFAVLLGFVWVIFTAHAKLVVGSSMVRPPQQR
jgi:hypothetical protein